MACQIWAEDITVVAAASVPLEIGGHEREPLAHVEGAAARQHGPHLGFAGEVADARTHIMSGRQQLDQAVAADEAGSAGHQHAAHLDGTPFATERAPAFAARPDAWSTLS